MLSDVLRCTVMQRGYHCQHTTTAALPFPLQKLYTKWMSAYSAFVKCSRHFDYDHTATQHNRTSQDCTSRNSVKLQQFLLAPLALNLIVVSNWPIVYWAFFFSKWPVEHAPVVWPIHHRTHWIRKDIWWNEILSPCSTSNALFWPVHFNGNEVYKRVGVVLCIHSTLIIMSILKNNSPKADTRVVKLRY
jgi:hypothetical protein